MCQDKLTKYLLLPALLLTSSLTLADESYRYSIAGLYLNTDYDNGSASSSLAGGAQLFTKPVSYETGPYEEASFLDRHTNASILLGADSLEIASEDINGNTYVLAVEYAEQTHPYTVGLIFSSSSADDSISGVSFDINSDELTLQAGYYLTPRSRILFGIGHQEGDFSINGSLFSDSESDSYEISYKNLETLNNDRVLSLQVGVKLTESDPNISTTDISLDADYYFNNATSVIVGLEIIGSGDDTEDGINYTIGAQHFINKLTSIGFEIEQFTAHEDDSDESTIKLYLEHRIN